jgi:hypothetical protein
MRKIVLALAALLCVQFAFSQKSAIQSTIQNLKDNDIAKAKELIDQATVNESTSGNAKAWLLKAVVYQAIGMSAQKDEMPVMNFIINDNPYLLKLDAAAPLVSSTPNALFTAIDAYAKSLSLDGKYSKEELSPLLKNLTFVHYNNGINQMNKSQFADASKSFEGVARVCQIDNKNFFKGDPQIDTINATAEYYQGYSYYQSNDERALQQLEASAKSPFLSNSDMYMMLLDLYQKSKNDAKWLETMKAARAKFPKEKRFIETEINYNIDNGRSEESIAKLKEGIASEPNRVDYYILLGQTYYQIANPEKGTRPANAPELEKNALDQFTKVAEKEPGNLYAQFFSGLIVFNQAKVVNDAMIETKDDKKYQELLPKRNELLEKAMGMLGKSCEIAEKEGINDGNRDNYRSALNGMIQGYGILSKAEKSAEAKKKLDGLR